MGVPNCTINLYEKPFLKYQSNRKHTSGQTLAAQMGKSFLPQKTYRKNLASKLNFKQSNIHRNRFEKNTHHICTVIHDHTTNQEQSEWNHSRIQNSKGAEENYQKEMKSERRESKTRAMIRLRGNETLTLNYVYLHRL